MCVGIADDEVEDGPVEQIAGIEQRFVAPFINQSEAVAEPRATLLFVFQFWWDAERLAEILLMQTDDVAGSGLLAVISLDHVDLFVSNGDNLCSRNRQADPGGKRHAECFVDDGIVKLRYGGLQYVRGGLGPFRDVVVAPIEKDRQFVLGPGKRKPDPLFASQEWMARQFVQLIR